MARPTIRPFKWAYGVTTVPDRFDTTLPKTLASLAVAGFDSPRLFIDGQQGDYPNPFCLEVTYRYPKVRTYGNWILALGELYIRTPNADRYAIFQDDFVTCRNLRQYLEKSKYPEKAYLNLYTYPDNLALCKGTGWHEANQRGLGALALVFHRDSVTSLLTHQSAIMKPQHATRGWRKIDGAVVTAMNLCGIREYIHNPSLVQHIGFPSSMGNSPQALAPSFVGESFDAMELLCREPSTK